MSILFLSLGAVLIICAFIMEVHSDAVHRRGKMQDKYLQRLWLDQVIELAESGGAYDQRCKINVELDRWGFDAVWSVSPNHYVGVNEVDDWKRERFELNKPGFEPIAFDMPLKKLVFRLFHLQKTASGTTPAYIGTPEMIFTHEFDPFLTA